MFDQNLAQTLHEACKVDEYDDSLHLMRAAQIVRRDMFNGDLFDGNFTTSSETNSVGKSLLPLLQLILEGPCIDDASEHCSRAALSISYLITFNSVKKSRANGHASGDKAASVRHNRCQESPLPIYISLLLHSVTRQRHLVDKFFHLGLCVSYDRLLENFH